VERTSSTGCDGRPVARTQGEAIADAIDSTEDAASGRPARPDGSASVSPRPPRVTLFLADGCHLCARALEVVDQVCAGDFERVDIAGSPELEEAYRESIPVVEIDGERAFTYFVQPEALRQRLKACG
jgi:hypothetical protein